MQQKLLVARPYSIHTKTKTWGPTYLSISITAAN